MLTSDAETSAALMAAFLPMSGFASTPRPALSWGEIEEEADVLKAICSSANDERVPGAILPRLDGDNLVFYAAAASPQAWRRLRPLLLSFAGPTFTDFSGLPTKLDPADEIEAWLSRLGLAVIAKLRTSETTAKACARSLQRMVTLLRMVRGPAKEQPMPTSYLLRCFRLALLSNDRNEAARLLQKLEAEFRLDTLNLQFLRVQMLASFADWSALRSARWFSALAVTRRPPSVTAALVEAIYRVDLAESVNDVAKAIKFFRERVRPEYEDLFTHLPPNASKPVLLAFALEALSWDPPRIDLLDVIRDSARDDSDIQHLLSYVAELPESAETAPPVAPAGNPIEQLRNLLTTAPASISVAREALILAFEIGSLEACDLVRQYVKGLPSKERDTLFETRWVRGLWEDILSIASEFSVRSWDEWLSAIGHSEFKQALTVAERGSAEWVIEQQLSDPGPVQRLARAIDAITGPYAESRFYEALPLLIDWLRQDPRYPCRLLLPVYQSLLDRIALSPSRASSDLDAAAYLTEAQLALGLSKSAFSDLIESLLVLIDVATGRRGVSWLLDLLELTLIHPATDETERNRLWYKSVDVLRTQLSLVDPVQRGVLASLLERLNIPGIERFEVPERTDTEAAGVFSRLQGMHVAIYSLTDRAARNAEALLKRWVPDLKVSLNHDHVATPVLKTLAQAADLFVVVTSSAKHAATTYIQTCRTEKPIVFPSGRGSSSIVEAVRIFAERET